MLSMEKEINISVHPLSSNATAAWEELKNSQVVRRIEPLPLDFPVSNKAVRFVCMADTHSFTSRLKVPIPPGDVFLHAGDFTRYGGYNEVYDFNTFLGSLPHKYKIVVAGNHELSFDPSIANDSTNLKSVRGTLRNVAASALPYQQIKEVRSLLTNCTYLEDSGTEVYGLSIYGTPWQPEYGNWAFNLPRGEACLEKWQKIPPGVAVLLTHSPPVGHGDFCVSNVRAGCVDLLNVVQKKVKPKYHVFGHIHEGYGITTDGEIIYINASNCNISYCPVNPPIIFDIPIPPGYTKT